MDNVIISTTEVKQLPLSGYVFSGISTDSLDGHLSRNVDFAMSGDMAVLGSFSGGECPNAAGNCSFVFGNHASAIGDSSYATGISTLANNSCSFAHGESVSAMCSCATAFGRRSVAGIADDRGHSAFAAGNSVSALGNYSFAVNDHTYSNDVATFAAGVSATAGHKYAFVWNGISSISYEDRGEGTFNVNPKSGISSFYIGSDNFISCVLKAVQGMSSS